MVPRLREGSGSFVPVVDWVQFDSYIKTVSYYHINKEKIIVVIRVTFLIVPNMLHLNCVFFHGLCPLDVFFLLHSNFNNLTFSPNYK